MDRLLAVTVKELKTFVADRQALVFSLVLPLVLILVLALTFGETPFNPTAYVVNLDAGPAGAEFVRRLDEASEITVELLDLEAADRRLETSDVVNVIVVPADFTARLESGRPPELLVKRRGTGGLDGQVVTSYAAAVAREMAGERLVVERVAETLAALGRSVPRADVEAKVEALLAEVGGDPSVTVAERAVGAPSQPVAIYLPGTVTMFTLFALSLNAVAIVRERRNGTLERLMTTRLTRGELLAGVWLGSLVRGLVQVVVLLAVGWAAFGLFTPAAFLATLGFGAVAVASVAAAGLVIASVARTPDQANWIAVFVTMTMTTLGGSFFDVTAVKGLGETVPRLTYNFWANDGMRRIILKGESLLGPAVARDMLVLAAFGAALAVLALLLFRQRGDDR